MLINNRYTALVLSRDMTQWLVIKTDLQQYVTQKRKKYKDAAVSRI